MDFGKATADAFGPDKADRIYDCAGSDATMGQAITYARKGSAIIQVAVSRKWRTSRRWTPSELSLMCLRGWVEWSLALTLLCQF